MGIYRPFTYWQFAAWNLGSMLLVHGVLFIYLLLANGPAGKFFLLQICPWTLPIGACWTLCTTLAYAYYQRAHRAKARRDAHKLGYPTTKI